MISNGKFYHYGKCTLNIRSNKDADNGKSITVSDGYTTKSATIVFGLATVEVLGNKRYIISMVSGGSVEATATVDVKYGETVDIDIHDPKASKASLNKKVDNIRMYSDGEGNVHFVNGAGADTVLNFKLKNAKLLYSNDDNDNLHWTVTGCKQYKYILARAQVVSNGKGNPYCTMRGISSFIVDHVGESGSNGDFEMGTWVYFGAPAEDSITIDGKEPDGKVRKASCAIWGIK